MIPESESRPSSTLTRLGSVLLSMYQQRTPSDLANYVYYYQYLDSLRFEDLRTSRVSYGLDYLVNAINTDVRAIETTRQRERQEWIDQRYYQELLKYEGLDASIDALQDQEDRDADDLAQK